LTDSIKVIKTRKEAKIAETAKRVVVAPVVEKPVETIPEPVVENNAPLQAPVVEVPEEVYDMNFSVKGTMHQLKVLKAFLIEIEIEFSNI
jgi:translation elongation factor EF-4